MSFQFTAPSRPFLLTLLACQFAAASTFATELDLGVNDDVVSAQVTADLNSRLNASVGYLYSDDAGQLLQGALHMKHDAGRHHFEFGAQMSTVWADHSPNGTVIGLGGRYALDLGSNLSFHAAGYYAPSVLSFNDIDGFYQLETKLQYDLNQDMGFYLGYRNIRFEYDNARDATFENGLFLGANIRF